MSRMGVLAAAALVALGAAWCIAAPGAGPPPAPAPPPAPVPRPPTCAESRLASFALDGALVREAVPLFRPYLSDTSPKWADHAARLEDWLRRKAAGRSDLLRDVGTLAKVLHRARPFDAPFTRGAFVREAAWERDDAFRITSVAGNLRPDATEYTGEKMRFSLVLPTTYPAETRRLGDVPPFPTLVVLHDRDDQVEGGKTTLHPGAVALRRRYVKSPDVRAGLQDWILFAPAAANGRFAHETRDLVTTPLEALWKRYSVDFDRIVLDGDGEAFAVAASRPNLFAGLVLRGGVVDPSLVRNLAGMPVYVVGTPDAPQVGSLRSGGLEPTVGKPEGVPAWLASVCARRRRTPRDFSWKVVDPVLHRLAHWIALHKPEPGTEMRVRVDAAANRVHVDVRGATVLHVFLNDRIVDLGRPVEIVVNGKSVRPPAPVVPALATMVRPVPRQPWILESRNFGWLYPVFLEGIRVPAPPAAPPSPPPASRPAGPR